jgi:hypothetical protein
MAPPPAPTSPPGRVDALVALLSLLFLSLAIIVAVTLHLAIWLPQRRVRGTLLFCERRGVLANLLFGALLLLSVSSLSLLLLLLQFAASFASLPQLHCWCNDSIALF